MLREIPGTYHFEHPGMGTIFEIFIAHEDEVYARQAATAAFEELDRLEQDLSRYNENSDISRINNCEAGRPVRVGLDTFDCLQIALQMHSETDGVFDITASGRQSGDSAEVHPAGKCGACRDPGYVLDESTRTIQLTRENVQLDLGGIGKGYAVDKMGELLRDWDVNAALIHGGHSSVLALDAPRGRQGWEVRVTDPFGAGDILERFDLLNRAMGASGLRKGPHIYSPRTGRPVEDTRAVWVCASSAVLADALSTALMVMSQVEIEPYCRNHRDVAVMIVRKPENSETQQERVLRFGSWPSTTG